jgi:DNA-binding HxlR family transcriptional regulator
MATYGQYCALAKALDVVGGRWTLLIVRELLIRGACRYTDLRNGLPGVATNLLADRLRELEEAGIVESWAAPPPIATTLYRLTPRGKELEPILLQLGNWGAPLLAKASKKDTFRSHWMALPIRLHLKDRTPDKAPIRIEVRTGEDEPLTIETRGGEIRTLPGAAETPDLVLSGSSPVVLGLLFGKLDFAAASAVGLKHEGDPRALKRLQARRHAPGREP